MYCISRVSNGTIEALRIHIDNPIDILNAISKAGPIMDLHASYSFVSESLEDIIQYSASATEKQQILHLHNLEKRVRGYLLESKMYLEHTKNRIPDITTANEYERRMLDLRDNDGVFAFVWELRNYIAHSSSLVQAFNESMHPCADKAKLLMHTRGTGPVWRWASGPYLSASPSIIDLVTIFEDNCRKINQLHQWLMKELLTVYDNDIRILADLGQKILATQGISDSDLWAYHFAQTVYDDDHSDVSEQDFYHPKVVRGITFEIQLLDWLSVFELNRMIP